MNDQEKINIAREFVSNHSLIKFSDLNEWVSTSQHDNDKLLTIFTNLTGGLYGEVRPTGFKHEQEIEIPARDSNTGNPIIFNFELSQ